MKISPARIAAFEILGQIESDRAFSSVLLPAYEEKLEAKDRGLCHELVLGTLRRQIFLDKTIEEFAGRKKLDTPVRIALRLGIYQILFLDKIPAYSAINESVNLVTRAKKTSAKGLVNAILRRVSERAPKFEYADEIERISVEVSHPRWLIEKWIAEFGQDEAFAIGRANNVVPRTTFRFTRSGNVLDERNAFEESQFVNGCYFVGAGDDRLRAMAAAGEIYFQDEASQLVAQAAASRVRGSFLDVCAAPGGKTTQVANQLNDNLIVAGDLSTARVELLKATCIRQGVGFVNVLRYDAEGRLPFADKSFDTVLVDAPCTGTGTIRHNPEIRYFLDPEDIPKAGMKQLAILRNASKVVQPGGRIIYSTCSLETEENEAVCVAFESETKEFQRVSPDVPQALLTDRGFARTFPHRDNMDGFLIAEFERLRH